MVQLLDFVTKPVCLSVSYFAMCTCSPIAGNLRYASRCTDGTAFTNDLRR
jgi:hypothetical protein